MERIYGQIADWRPGKKFGIIKGENKRTYFAPTSKFGCEYSKLDAIHDGSYVAFDISLDPPPEGKLIVAENIELLDKNPIPGKDIDPEYRESGIISHWDNDFHKKFGFIERPSGKKLFFHRTNILPDFQDRIAEIRPGLDRIFYGIQKMIDGRVQAHSCELFSREENDELANAPLVGDEELFGGVDVDKQYDNQDEVVPRVQPVLPPVPEQVATIAPVISPPEPPSILKTLDRKRPMLESILLNRVNRRTK